jgi:hypothetical protein
MRIVLSESTRYFDHYRSGDHYYSEAITHVMACTSHLPGAFLRAHLMSGQQRGHSKAKWIRVRHFLEFFRCKWADCFSLVEPNVFVELFR